jgi:hypothetical protein
MDDWNGRLERKNLQGGLTFLRAYWEDRQGRYLEQFSGAYSGQNVFLYANFSLTDDK